MKWWALVAVFGLLATSAHVRAEDDSDVGGLTPEEEEEAVKNMTSTKFLGTEYDPNKCLLQYASLECEEDKDCGYLNGYKLECVNLGRQNGRDKRVCDCPVDEDEEETETKVCQRSVGPGYEGVEQFGDCRNGKSCVSSYGHTPPRKESRVCAEMLHCVKEVDSDATLPAEVCHTCRSCIQQNDSADKLEGVKRFDCTAICPPEILKSLQLRNEQGVGIADDLKSKTGSKSKKGDDDDEEEEEDDEDGEKAEEEEGGRRGPRGSANAAVLSTLTGLALASVTAYMS